MSDTPPTMFSICERIVREALFADPDAFGYIDWDLVSDAYTVMVDLAEKGA